MSDGISEGYRAARASDQFEKLWQDAQVENILLDFKRKFENDDIEHLIYHLMELCPRVQIKNYDKFAIPYEKGHYYSDSAPAKSDYAKVRLYEIEVSGLVHRRFVNSNFRSGLIEATLFVEWTNTVEGRSAVRIYNDW